jgi:tRNA dimethylallyltransferase
MRGLRSCLPAFLPAPPLQALPLRRRLRRCLPLAMAASPAPAPAATTRPRVLILAGPTAVGKSAVAMSLATSPSLLPAAAEIISADSVQVYRRLDVGSNKPSPAERARVPHHLVSTHAPSAPHSAGDFLAAATAAVADVARRGRVPLVVGGTMMYLRWLVHGCPATPPGTPAAAARADALLAAAGGDWDEAAAVLRARDPARADAVSRNDWYRLRRALQVAEEPGGAVVGALPIVGAAPGAGVARSDTAADFRCFFLFDDRVELNRRIDRRCEAMILPAADGGGDGFDEQRSVLVEVAGLLTSRAISTAHGSPARAIGYRQTIGYLLARAEAAHGGADGDDDALDAFRAFADDFRRASRGYAKQQMQWFRKEAGYVWVRAGADAAGAVAGLYGLGEAAFEAQLSDAAFAAEQAAARDEVLAHGRRMRTYGSVEEVLVRAGDAEAAAVRLAQRCARDVLDGLGGVHEVRRLRAELAEDGR